MDEFLGGGTHIEHRTNVLPLIVRIEYPCELHECRPVLECPHSGQHHITFGAIEIEVRMVIFADCKWLAENTRLRQFGKGITRMSVAVDHRAVSQIPMGCVPLAARKRRMAPITVNIAIIHCGLNSVESVSQLRTGHRLPDFQIRLHIVVQPREISGLQ